MAESTTGHYAGPARHPRHHLPDTLHPTGPIPFLHPTKRYHPVLDTLKQPRLATRAHELPLPHPFIPTGHRPGVPTPPLHDQIYHVWKSRDNRKGRHRHVITGPGAKEYDTGRKSKVRKMAVGVSRMATRFPVWDISYLVAVSFTIGSVIWCINGFFTWLPLVSPAADFPDEANWAGIMAFVGATVFEIGSVLMVVEAIQAGGSDYSGWALEKTPDGGGVMLLPTTPGRRHFHHPTLRKLKKEKSVQVTQVPVIDGVPESRILEDGNGGDGEVTMKVPRDRWLPTFSELKAHYLKEIGFLGSSVQLVAATIFWIAGITALPPIFNSMSRAVMNGVFWVPQVVGGFGFILSAFMFMVEVQDKWYIPAPRLLGWHVGLWNFIGGIGFTVCAGIGFAAPDSTGLEYASALSTFIGSWAFLIGSILQWYESLDKHPVSVDKPPSWLSEKGGGGGNGVGGVV